MPFDRDRIQLTVRLGALGFVVAWLFSPWLQERIPWWLAFVVLAASEVEFVVRGLRSPRVEPARRGRAPGSDDADLGWGTIVEDDDGVHWVPPPTREPHRGRRRVTAAATATVGFALLVLALRTDARAGWSTLTPAERAATERVVVSESGRIAGRPVRVTCDEDYAFTGARTDALGVAYPDRGLAFIHPDVCRTIHDLTDGRHVSDDRAAEAVVVLAHEATHLRGIRDEGITECYALQEGVTLGRRLGLSPGRSARLMRLRYAEALAERNVVRAAYALPRGCESGGTYDLRASDSSFP